jgi:hypothetical protein
LIWMVINVLEMIVIKHTLSFNVVVWYPFNMLNPYLKLKNGFFKTSNHLFSVINMYL